MNKKDLPQNKSESIVWVLSAYIGNLPLNCNRGGNAYFLPCNFFGGYRLWAKHYCVWCNLGVLQICGIICVQLSLILVNRWQVFAISFIDIHHIVLHRNYFLGTIQEFMFLLKYFQNFSCCNLRIEFLNIEAFYCSVYW